MSATITFSQLPPPVSSSGAPSLVGVQTISGAPTDVLFGSAIVQTFAVASGDSETIAAAPASRIYADFTASATLSSLTVTMPTAGFDSQIVTLTFQSDVTALTISPASGQTFLVAPPTSATAGGSISYRWKTSVSQWWPL